VFSTNERKKRAIQKKPRQNKRQKLEKKTQKTNKNVGAKQKTPSPSKNTFALSDWSLLVVLWGVPAKTARQKHAKLV